LLTQQNKQTFKHLQKYLPANTYLVVHTTRHILITTSWFVDKHIDTLKTIQLLLLWLVNINKYAAAVNTALVAPAVY